VLVCQGAPGLRVSGERAEAQTLLQEMLQLAEVRYIPALDFAIVSIGLGDTNGALDWLDKAEREHSNYLIYICHDALYDPLRPEPRFQNLVQRLGLPSLPPETQPGVCVCAEN
jgi:hypothetical protein